MWKNRVDWIVGMLACLSACQFEVTGQSYMLADTTIMRLNDILERLEYPPRSNVEYTIDYTIAGFWLSFISGSSTSEKGQIICLQSLKYSWVIEKPGRLTLTNTFSHRLAVQCYFDSVTRIQADENYFRTRLEVRMTPWICGAFDSELNTRLLNGYDYEVDDSNRMIKRLNSSFLTPLVWNLALGITLRLPETGTLMLGLTGARLTCLRDTSVFAAQQTDVYRGVRRGSDHLFEYGISCRLQTDRTFLKILRWNCDLLAFKAYRKAVSLNLKNLLEVRPVKFLSVSVQTRMFYEEEVSRSLRMENLLTVGFSFKK